MEENRATIALSCVILQPISTISVCATPKKNTRNEPIRARRTKDNNNMCDHSLKRQLKTLTIPVFIEMALVMMMGAVDTVMLSRYSDNSVAAVGLDNQLISLVFLVYQFFSMGAAILCAQYLGAGLRKRFVQVVGLALVVNLLLGSVLMAFSGKGILSVFTDNQEIIAMGCWVLVIDCILEIGRSANIFAVGTLRATGDAIYPVCIGIIFQWSVAVALSYFVGIELGYGLVGMWVCFALDENLRGVILMRRWRSGKWKTKGFVKIEKSRWS